MANQLATPSWTLKEVGRKYENSIKFINHVNRTYDDRYTVNGAKVGDSINYRLPSRFTVSDGQALELQNILDQTVPISLTNQKHVDMAWSAWQGTTQIDDVQNRYTDPAGLALASKIDNFAAVGVYRDIYNTVGTLGTTPSTTQTYLDAFTKLIDGAMPPGGLVAVLDIAAMTKIANATSTLFNPGSTIGDNYRDGLMGRNQLGIAEWYFDQNRPSFTSGAVTVASTPLVNGASQTGTSLITDGWGSGGFAGKRGDKFTIGGVYGVNPLSYESTGRLQDFVLAADINDTTGDATLTISPSIVTSGALQTVSNSPANNAVITYWSMAAGGTFASVVSPTSLVYHKDAFAFVTADLEMPNGGAKARRINSKVRGLAFRMAEQWDIRTDQNITRIDTLVGVATLQARLAARVQG